MTIKKNNKIITEDFHLKSVPAMGSKIEYKGKKYIVQAFLIEKETNNKVIEVI